VEALNSLFYFFLDKWLWAMTWGIYHIPINILVMLILLKFVGRLKIVPLVLLAFFSKIFSSVGYTLMVLFIVFVVNLDFPLFDYNYVKSINLLLNCIYLGLIYSAFQSLFFFIVNKFYVLNLHLIILITCISNMLSALIVHKFLEYS